VAGQEIIHLQIPLLTVLLGTRKETPLNTGHTGSMVGDFFVPVGPTLGSAHKVSIFISELAHNLHAYND
jgi:hypothetical protein